MQPVISEVEQFLTTLEPEATPDTIWCWQIVRPPIMGKNLFSGLPVTNKRVSGWCFHASFRAARTQLAAENANRSAIFVAINETDGVLRRNATMQRIRALVLDLDGAPLEPVRALPVPNLIVESSPGKYHVYWRVTDVPLEEYARLELALAESFDGDKSVGAPSQVMRVPGFYHHKAAPFLTHIIAARRTWPPTPFRLWKHILRDKLKPRRPASTFISISCGTTSMLTVGGVGSGGT